MSRGESDCSAAICATAASIPTGAAGAVSTGGMAGVIIRGAITFSAITRSPTTFDVTLTLRTSLPLRGSGRMDSTRRVTRVPGSAPYSAAVTSRIVSSLKQKYSEMFESLRQGDSGGDKPGQDAGLTGELQCIHFSVSRA